MKHLVFLPLCSASLLAQLTSDIDMLHRTVPLDGANLHAIVTKPRTPGRHPAVFVISGLGCYPIESLRKKQHTEFDTDFLKRVEEWMKQNLRRS
jgi:hypothetical protein